jgi:hypothetical protein
MYSTSCAGVIVAKSGGAGSNASWSSTACALVDNAIGTSFRL